MSSAQITLATAVAQAVSFITRPLAAVYPPAVVQQLEKASNTQLQAAFALTWSPHDPSHGSHHRRLPFTYGGQPSQPLYEACTAAGIRWSEWMRCLGGEFILMVDPGRVGCEKSDGQYITIWKDAGSSSLSGSKGHTRQKTMAQKLLEDESDEEIFTLINREVHGSGPRPDSRMSTTSSSCSSGSGSQHTSPSTMSRRERARMAKVFIDTSKTDVTQFDGGKTKILTGAVMLGRPSS